jgi:opacity protein-like surface antigen
MKKLLAASALALMFASPAFAADATTTTTVDPCGCYGNTNTQVSSYGDYNYQSNYQVSDYSNKSQQIAEYGSYAYQYNYQAPTKTYAYTAPVVK